MRPEDNQTNRRVGTPQQPSRAQGTTFNTGQQQAAADIVRSQIDSIYNSQDPQQPQPQTQPVQPSQTQPAHASQPQTQYQPQQRQILQPERPENQQIEPKPAEQTQPQSVKRIEPTQQPLEASNPYDRSTKASGSADIQKQQWQQYHSAWQNYYQRYYERYYVNQVGRARASLENRASQAARSSQGPTEAIESSDRVGLSKDDALRDLRERLLNKVKDRAVKVRKSRHFIPIIAAICVVFVFAFLQYNRVLFGAVQAYVMPGNMEPQNLVVDPTNNDDVGEEPRLIIPKINVDVPVVYGVGNDYNSQMKAMEKGVAHFAIPGANSVPGQVGNTVLSGHSSNDWLDKGDYKFIFAQLSKLKKGDVFYANYKGKRYTYEVTKKEEVKPTEVSALVYDTDKPVMTLITCTPLGTALRRLLVTAEQVSPDPAAAKPADSNDGNSGTSSIPGNSPTFVERIFGG